MPNIRLSDAIAEFSTYASTGYAAGTVRGLRSSLDKFLEETGNVWLKNVTTTHVDRYTEARHAAGIHPHTVRNNITHLRMFMTWARQRKYVPLHSDVIGKRRTRRVIPHDFTIIPSDEFPSLLDAARNPRDRAIIAFGLYTLSRQSEVAATRVGDLDLSSGWVTLRIQKSGVLDKMPVSAELNVEMHRWLQVYEQVMEGPLDPDWRLLPALRALGHERNEKGQLKPVPEGLLRIIPTRSPSKIHWAVQRAMEDLGYPVEKEGVHTLRRSAARARFDQLVSSGYDGALREVQSLLHHKSSVTTEHYLGLAIEVRNRNEAIRGKRMFGPSQGPGLRSVSVG